MSSEIYLIKGDNRRKAIAQLLEQFDLKQLIAFVCLLAILWAYSPLPAFSEVTAENAPLISLEAKEEKLKDVLKKIANDTGYRVFLNEEWENMAITIRLHNETLGGAIDRLLRGLNYAITWDETEKTLWLFICSPGKCSGAMWDVSLSGQKIDQASSTIVR